MKYRMHRHVHYQREINITHTMSDLKNNIIMVKVTSCRHPVRGLSRAAYRAGIGQLARFSARDWLMGPFLS